LELQELKARVGLNALLPQVLSRLETIKRRAVLDGCRGSLQTRTISTKSKAFANQAVTVALRQALEDELRALGTIDLPLTFANRSDKGKTKFQLKATTVTQVSLDGLLSEGEQRAITISAFLAELRLSGHKGGIVLDDPVSSSITNANKALPSGSP
jgi:uncharacterized protein YceK